MRHNKVKVINRAVNVMIREAIQSRTTNQPQVLCGCGCGQMVNQKPSPMFVQGHDSKLKAVYRQIFTGQASWTSIPLEIRRQLNRKKVAAMKKQLAGVE